MCVATTLQERMAMHSPQQSTTHRKVRWSLHFSCSCTTYACYTALQMGKKPFCLNPLAVQKAWAKSNVTCAPIIDYTLKSQVAIVPHL